MQTFLHNNKVLLTTLFSSTLLSGCYWDDPRTAAQYVSSNISKNDVVNHLVDLEARASTTTDGSSITRAAGTSGYTQSKDYIVQAMQENGYIVTTQEFDFRAWEELAGTSLTVNGVKMTSSHDVEDGTEPDFSVMSYSGDSNGTIEGDIAFVTPDFRFDAEDYDDTDGCEASDFEGKALTSKIVAIQRGGCSFSDKVVNAEQAGAKAVIIFNQGNSEGRTGVISGTLSNESTATIPAFGTRYDLGKQWYESSLTSSVPATLTVSVDDKVVVIQNIIAETRKGDPNQVVMLGAHLDSVPSGPGINDNGSGSAGLLEYAATLADLNAPVKNKVRFAWWAAEESGLVGSTHYTDDLFSATYDKAQTEVMKQYGVENAEDLTEAQVDLVEDRYNELNKVKLYLNFDMIGSPNYIFGVMDGDLSDTKDSPDNAYTGDFTPPYGTSDIESILMSFFGFTSNSTVPQALSKRSDYAGFADWGVAFGGLFTGAEKVKTVEEAEQFGGDVGVAYDRCYHQSCDDLNNVNQDALYVNTQALAYVTTYYAFSQPIFPVEETAVSALRTSLIETPTQKLRIGDKLKAAHSHSDHGHFHGDFDQDKE